MLNEYAYSSPAKYAKTSYVYDALGRVTSKTAKDQTNALVAQETYAYDDAANSGQYQKVTKTILGGANAPSIVTTSYADKLGRIAKQGKFLNGTEYFDIFTYDYVGNLITEKTARTAQEFSSSQYTKKWEYDYANRPVK